MFLTYLFFGPFVSCATFFGVSEILSLCKAEAAGDNSPRNLILCGVGGDVGVTFVGEAGGVALSVVDNVKGILDALLTSARRLLRVVTGKRGKAVQCTFI